MSVSCHRTEGFDFDTGCPSPHQGSATPVAGTDICRIHVGLCKASVDRPLHSQCLEQKLKISTAFEPCPMQECELEEPSRKLQPFPAHMDRPRLKIPNTENHKCQSCEPDKPVDVEEEDPVIFLRLSDIAPALRCRLSDSAPAMRYLLEPARKKPVPQSSKWWMHCQSHQGSHVPCSEAVSGDCPNHHSGMTRHGIMRPLN